MPDPIPDGSVVITPSEQYQRTAEQFGAISEKLSELQRDLNPLPAQVAEHDAYINSLRQAGLPESMTQLKTDVTRIDRTQIKGLGYAGGIAAVIAIIGTPLVQAVIKAVGG